jgi:hypothetical protein
MAFCVKTILNVNGCGRSQFWVTLKMDGLQKIITETKSIISGGFWTNILTWDLAIERNEKLFQHYKTKLPASLPQDSPQLLSVRQRHIGTRWDVRGVHKLTCKLNKKLLCRLCTEMLETREFSHTE